MKYYAFIDFYEPTTVEPRSRSASLDATNSTSAAILPRRSWRKSSARWRAYEPLRLQHPRLPGHGRDRPAQGHRRAFHSRRRPPRARPLFRTPLRLMQSRKNECEKSSTTIVTAFVSGRNVSNGTASPGQSPRQIFLTLILVSLPGYPMDTIHSMSRHIRV